MKYHPLSVGAFIGNRMCGLDAVEHEGEILIVLSWLRNTTAGLMKPRFVLPLSSVVHTSAPENSNSPVRWMLFDQLPEDLLNLSSLADSRQYAVREGPDVQIPIPAVH